MIGRLHTISTLRKDEKFESKKKMALRGIKQLCRDNSGNRLFRFLFRLYERMVFTSKGTAILHWHHR